MKRFFSTKKAVEYVKKKGWKNDRNNDLYIISCDGEIYNAKKGKLKKRV